MKITTAAGLKVGDKITIAGCGTTKRGQAVWNGIGMKTGKKAKVASLTVFVVQDADGRIEPAGTGKAPGG